jgi:hypothetical protein
MHPQQNNFKIVKYGYHSADFREARTYLMSFCGHFLNRFVFFTNRNKICIMRVKFNLRP